MYYVPLPVPKEFLRLFVEHLWGGDPSIRRHIHRKTQHSNPYVYTYALCGFLACDSSL